MEIFQRVTSGRRLKGIHLAILYAWEYFWSLLQAALLFLIPLPSLLLLPVSKATPAAG